jgi:hypothetical protein
MVINIRRYLVKTTLVCTLLLMSDARRHYIWQYCRKPTQRNQIRYRKKIPRANATQLNLALKLARAESAEKQKLVHLTYRLEAVDRMMLSSLQHATQQAIMIHRYGWWRNSYGRSRMIITRRGHNLLLPLGVSSRGGQETRLVYSPAK